MSPQATLPEASMNQTYSANENATLECNSEGGPGNTYLWQKDGLSLDDENSSVLMLYNVTFSTGGTYNCFVSNAAGNHSASTLLFVFPYFLEQPVNVVLTSAGYTFNLTCIAAAFPEPEYQWGREDGRDIRTDVLVNMSLLTFSSVQFGDEGSYYCNATSNSRVNTSSSVLVTSKYNYSPYN